MSTPPHVYLSTACMHELHDKCRKTCKYCHQRCVCECHSGLAEVKPSGAIAHGPLVSPSIDLQSIEGWVLINA